MLDKNKHKVMMAKILKDIYSDLSLGKYLGFKGGTAAFLFYGLPRFSVDLDFDLLDLDKKKEVFVKLKKILAQYGQIQDSTEKKYTLFFLLSYQGGKRKIKVEISKRAGIGSFTVMNYLGIPMLVMVKRDMAANKLTALLTRKNLATRDIFDLWYLLKNDFNFNADLVKQKTGLTMAKAFIRAEKKARAVPKNRLLQGLGDLLEEKQKNWVKEKMVSELAFLLRLYVENKL